MESDIESPGQLKTSSIYSSDVITISNLRPACPYHFRIALCSPTSRSPLSTIISFVTASTTPEPPSNLCMAPLDADHSALTFAHVKWLPPFCDNGSPVTAYNVELASKSGNGNNNNNNNNNTHHTSSGGKRKTDFSLVEQTTTCSCLLSNLQPGMTYAIRVQAMNAYGLSTVSEVLFFTAGSLVPDQVETPFLLNHPTDRQATVAWTEPTTYGSDVLGYHVIMQPGDRNYLLGNVRNITLKKLQPETEYSVKVAACSALGEGAFSSPLVFMTDERMAGVPVMGEVEKEVDESGNVRLWWSSAKASETCPVEK